MSAGRPGEEAKEAGESRLGARVGGEHIERAREKGPFLVRLAVLGASKGRSTLGERRRCGDGRRLDWQPPLARFEHLAPEVAPIGIEARVIDRSVQSS
jgi:hypothetical protein